MSFTPGQVFQLPGLDPGATAIVCHVDHDGFGTVVYVRIDGVGLPGASLAGGVTDGIQLMPFTEDALADSIGPMLAEDVAPGDWESAYDAWHEAIVEGEATIWTIPVHDAVQIVQGMMAG